MSDENGMRIEDVEGMEFEEALEQFDSTDYAEEVRDLSMEELEELESELYELQACVDGLWDTVVDTVGREQSPLTEDVADLVEEVSDVRAAVGYERNLREEVAEVTDGGE